MHALTRRALLGGALGTLAAPAFAYNRCEPQAAGRPGELCHAGLTLKHLDFASQQASQWCWAAAVSNIFDWYGYALPQEAIVSTVYGRTVNLPAFSGVQMSRLLSRSWRDRHGRSFGVRIQGLYDSAAGVGSIDNAQIVAALAAERPLLYGNLSHAMVLTAVSYWRPPGGGMPVLAGAGFFDPWPGRGLRGPDSPLELLPVHRGGHIRYLALPAVVPL